MKRSKAVNARFSRECISVTDPDRARVLSERCTDEQATPPTDRPTHMRAFEPRALRRLRRSRRGVGVALPALSATQVDSARLRLAIALPLPTAIRRMMSAAAACTMLICGFCAPPAALAEAGMNFGNYNLNLPDRYDFHTWIWAITNCSGTCVRVSALAQPVARAFLYSADAALANGHYTLAVDVSDGLRCGNIYYGPIATTHDVYTWDATTLAGTLNSTFDTGCDGEPGTLTYPFTLTRL
jgi:hypothetical protein